MRFPRTLSLYLAREMSLFTLLCFSGIAFVLVCQQLLERLETLLEVGLDGPHALLVLQYVFAILAPHALPMAFAFGVTLAVGRLAAGREILAMRSLGNGLTALVVPALALGLAVVALTGWLVRDVEPHARVSLRRMLTELALRGSIVQEGRFRGVEDRVIFVEERTAEGELHGIVIYDRTTPERSFALFARGGRLESDDATGVLHLSLERGTIAIDAPDEAPPRVRSVRFETARYSVAAESLLDDRHDRRNPDELAFHELAHVIARIDAGQTLEGVRKPRRDLYELERHRRLAAPLAAPAFGLVAIGLGLATPRRSRSLAILACTAAVFGFYGLTSLGRYLTREHRILPALAIWVPMLVTAIVALVVLRRGGRRVAP